ncbi:MAG: phage tail tape measure protein [Bacteroidales bacterium]|jgi:hypothetical protein|nr:phage tail tape measure protein [Bacteroidales bacterium]
MKAFTLKTVLVSVDKSSKTVNKITKAYGRMSRNITIESKVAGFSFKAFARGVGMQSKRVLVSLNTMNASVNRVFRGISKKLGGLGLILGFTVVLAGLRNIIGVIANFEQANASLSSILADATRPELKALSDEAKRLGSVTAKSSTEVVGLQEAFARLGFATPQVINMTEATISGSIAMNGELSKTAELVGAMVSTFGYLDSADAPAIIDQMTKSTQKSALNFEKLESGLPNVAGAANAAGIPFTKLLSLLGKLSDAGIDASTSSTALKNIFIKSAAKGLDYNQILDEIVNSQDKLTAANDKFGVRASVSGAILASKLQETADLEIEIIKSTGAAREAAKKQLDTLKGSVTLLKSAWEGWILGLEDGTGKFSNFLKTSVRVASEILSIATGTEKMAGTLNEAELRIRKLANRALFFLKVLKWITIAFVAFKAVVLLSNAAMVAYNIVMGITGALFGTMTKGIALNAAALTAYKVVTGIATAAQWLLNTAFYGFPLVWIIAGIAALVVGIVLLITHWKEIVTWVKESDNWFAKFIRASIYPLIVGFKLIKGAINLVIDIFKNLINWVKTSDNLFAKFARGGINGIKFAFQAVGDALKWVGDQFSKVWDWIKKVSGVALQPIKDIINFFSKETQKELGISAKKEIEIVDSSPLAKELEVITKEDKLTGALDKNSDVIEKNTDAAKKEWSGKFYTSILKDANISEGSSKIVQRELAVSSITNENNIVSDQKDINNAPQSVVTQSGATQRNSKPVNGTITVNVVDKTGGNFALEVEGTGINVVTTGNA